MVVLRESSRARPSPSKSTARWPPASPLEALLSSPNGRKKWADIEGGRRERSASPSSRKIRMDSESMDDSAIQDEESLRLELQILETKKRLRDLERKRGQEQIGVSTTSPTKRRRIETTTQDVLVQLSPTKTTITVAPPASPVRALLGIDNKRADSVSFKRPVGTKASHIPPAAEPRPVSSFNKRLAGIRATIQDKQEKSDRLDSIRSKSFADISARTHASSQSSAPHRPSLQPAPSITGGAYDSAPKRRKTTSKDEDFYDAFSEIHLSSRQLSHTDVARSLAGCEIYTLPRLLKEVKGPSYEPPGCDKDYVVFGILAEKTSPFQQQENAKVLDRHKDQDGTRLAKNKFMVMRLCDLQWQVDCYLFGTGFEQYWKLTEGTLIAILNPAIMPPRTNQHNGRFSLKVASSEDTILEIGKARDLGYCTAVKKDGKECSSWVNKAKSAYCEFHVNLAVNKSRKGRMEVNTMTRGQEPQVYRAKPNQNIHRHWESGEVWSAGHSLKRVGAAKLLDDDDTDALHNLTRDEISRKRIAASQRERDLAKKLGEISGGVAGGYFRAKYGTEGTGSSSTPSEPMFAKPSAAELGLLSRKADEQRLSPAKDRRRHFGIGAISSAGTEALGWGGARKYGLLEPRQSRLGSPERGQTRLDAPRARSALRSPDRDRSMSPTKQARFKLAKGIRQPGRESGGNDLITKHDDDDDDLDIV